VGGVLIGAKNWMVEEDQRLIRAWINMAPMLLLGQIRRSVPFGRGLPPISTNTAHVEPQFVLGKH